MLTNSWGGDNPFPPQGPPDPGDNAMVAEIRDAIAQNIVVIFSAGNGHFGVEPQVPGVIAAGGVFATAALDLQGSTYSSGYRSPWFGGVQVPTVSGLVGDAPARLLHHAAGPGGLPDRRRARGRRERRSRRRHLGQRRLGAVLRHLGRGAADRGRAALLRGIRKNATPAAVAKALSDTATDVRAGACHPRFNNQAVAGRDLATGFGLVNVSAAAGVI